jgi:two-component system, NarL family, response regulator NreC
MRKSVKCGPARRQNAPAAAMKGEGHSGTTLIVVDDHAIVREGIIALLSADPTIQVIGESSEPGAAIPLVNRLHPDILLLDLVLRDKHGLDVLRNVRGKTKVIILSMRADELYVAEALHFGAAGYLLKEATSGELLEAIRTVAKGGLYLSSNLNKKTVNELLNSFKTGNHSRDPYITLTARERTILPLAAEGLTSAIIGEKLSISARTVEVHRSRLMKKLGLKSQTELVRYAARKKLVVL